MRHRGRRPGIGTPAIGPRFSVDFTKLSVGVASLPSGLVLTRAASSSLTDYFAIASDASSLGTAAANQARIGYVLGQGASGSGLLVESAVTNLAQSSATLATGWNAGPATLTTGQADPAGGTTGVRIQASSGQWGPFQTYSVLGSLPPIATVGIWYRRGGVVNSTYQTEWYNADSIGGLSATATSTWALWTFTRLTGFPNFFLTDTRAFSGNPAVSSSDGDIAFVQYQVLPYMTSPILSPSGVNGARAADILHQPNAGVMVDATGRLGLHVQLVLPAPIAQLSAPPTFWYVDTNNKAVMTSGRKVAVTIGGTTWTTSGELNADAGLVDVWVAAGGGSLVSEVWLSTDGGTTGQLIGKSDTAQGALATSGNLYLMSTPSSGGQWDAALTRLEAA